MASLGGSHVQSRTGRELTFWCAYEIVDATSLCLVSLVYEDLATLGQHEATLRFDPHGIPAEAIARVHVIRYIEDSVFGAGRLPEARWIGWFGPYR